MFYRSHETGIFVYNLQPRMDTWDDIDAELDKLKALSLDYNPSFAAESVSTGYSPHNEFAFSLDTTTSCNEQPVQVRPSVADLEYSLEGDPIPPLEDMLSLVTDRKVLNAYRATSPISSPRNQHQPGTKDFVASTAPVSYKSPLAQTTFGMNDKQEKAETFEQPPQNYQPPTFGYQNPSLCVQPQQYQRPCPPTQMPNSTPNPLISPRDKDGKRGTLLPLPPLDLTTWQPYQCQALVKHIQLHLQEILQDAIYVKKLDLRKILADSRVRESEEKKVNEIMKSTANKLRTVKEISGVIAHIDCLDTAHNALQREITGLVEVSVSSTVKMLRTVLNIFAFKAAPEQFEYEFQPFLANIRKLIQLLPQLHWKTGHEVFYLY